MAQKLIFLAHDFNTILPNVLFSVHTAVQALPVEPADIPAETRHIFQDSGGTGPLHCTGAIEGRKIELELSLSDANVNILSRTSWRRGF